MSLEDGQSTDDELDALLARAVVASQGVDPATIARGDDAAGAPGVDTLSTSPPTSDELRRLTIMFSDLVGSTSLSARLDPETYRGILGAYMDTCRRVIEDGYEGHLVQTRGDGILAVFGYPTAHEDDALRAVKAGLEIHRALTTVSEKVHQTTSIDLHARIGVHRGLVYVARDTEELYGFAVNVAARIQEAADPGTVAISEEVRRLVADFVWTEALEPRAMKGVDQAPSLHLVLEERPRAGRVPHWQTPLVGRDDELDELRALHGAGASADHPVAALVAGEPGVGKTRLVGAFLDELPRGTPLLELGGSPFHRQQGLHPIREVLHELAQIPTDRPAAGQLAALRDHLARRGLEHLVPLLAPVAGIGPDGGYEPVEVDPRLLREQIGDAVHELLVDWLAERPGVLFVDDLHWLDDATLAVLERLIASGPAGLCVLMTSREAVAPGGDRTRHLQLDPLSGEACAALIRLHDADIPIDVAAEVAARSDGIPLFVEELVRSRHEVNLEPTVVASAEASVPSTLYDPLSARLNTLPEARLVVSAAAAIGRTVNLDLLARVSGVAMDDLDRAVSTLVEQQVLEPDQGDGRSVRFRHELVRQVAYELEPPSGRQRFHSLAAASLSSGELAAAADWTLIAEHHRRGGQPWAAAQAFEHAADDARRRGSLEEARANFDRALEAILEVESGAARDRREIQLRLHRAFLAVSSEGFGSEHAAQDYRRSLELCVEYPASDEMYQTLIALWGYYVNRSDLDRAWAVSTALRGLTQGDRAPLLPTNTAGFGMIEWYRGSFDESVRYLGEAVAAVDEVGVDETSVPSAWTMPLDPVSSMHIHLALARFSVGDPVGAREQEIAALDRCRSLPFPLGPFTQSYVLLLQGLIRLEEGDHQDGQRLVREAGALAERHGFDAWQFANSIVARAIEGLVADEADGPAIASEVLLSVQLWHAIGVRVLTGFLQSLVCRVLLRAGDHDGAMTAAKEAIATAAETGSEAFLADAHRVLALAGPPDQVERGLIDALARAETQGSVPLAVRIAADLVRSCGAAHLPRLQAVVARVGAGVDYPDLTAARALLDAT
jgi:class 3 adenylate cyclase/tetratricopeptide (TPR) repeat protein